MALSDAGRGVAQIAQDLGLAITTVRSHLCRAQIRSGVRPAPPRTPHLTPVTHIATIPPSCDAPASPPRTLLAADRDKLLAAIRG